MAIEPIAAGDEIVISYTSEWQKETERQHELQQLWGFTADCDSSRGAGSQLMPLDDPSHAQAAELRPSGVRREESAEFFRLKKHAEAQMTGSPTAGMTQS